DAKNVAYSSFSFGKPYNEIKKFIEENELGDSVQLAVPAMVIDELKVQKQRQYEKDIQLLKEISKRRNGLPCDTEGFSTPLMEQFDFTEYVEAEAKKYIE